MYNFEREAKLSQTANGNRLVAFASNHLMFWRAREAHDGIRIGRNAVGQWRGDCLLELSRCFKAVGY